VNLQGVKIMPLWLRKLVVVLITVFTLGLVTPPTHFLTGDSESTSKADVVKTNADKNDEESDLGYQLTTTLDAEQYIDYQLPWPEIAASISSSEDINTHFLNYTKHHADKQTMVKFGERIQNKVGQDYLHEISPKIEEVITSLCNDLNTDTIRNLAVSNKPSSGYGEKIFHIYDIRDGSDQLRVHVRREHPPQDGYWFTFHYHTAEDNFQSHNNLGKLYWDKNMPPKWMAKIEGNIIHTT
jgi:hypothetical protein